MITGRSQELARLAACWEQGMDGPSCSSLAKTHPRDQEGFGIEYPYTKARPHLQEVGEKRSALYIYIYL